MGTGGPERDRLAWEQHPATEPCRNPTPAFSHPFVLFLTNWNMKYCWELSRAQASLPALANLAACCLAPFLGEESWEQRMSEDRGGPCRGRSHRRAVASSPFRRSRPEHPPGHSPEALWEVLTQPAPPGSGWGQRDTPLPDQAREPLTSTHRYNHTGTQFFEIKKSRPLTG